MIQAYRLSNVIYENLVRLNLYDKMTDITYKPLYQITSLQSNKTKYFISNSIDTSNKDRYIETSFKTNYEDTELLVGGLIYLGTDDFPYGLYDVTIYQNSGTSNLDPDGLTQIYSGLMNLTASGNESVEYTEYTTNDSDTDSVYITNTYI